MNYSFDTITTFQDCDRLLTTYCMSQQELENRLEPLQKKYELLVKKNESAFIALALIEKKKKRLLREIRMCKSPVRMEGLNKQIRKCEPRRKKILDQMEQSRMPLLFDYEAEMEQIIIELKHLQPLIAGICKQRVALSN